MRLAELAALQEKLASRHPNAAPRIKKISLQGLPGVRDLDLRLDTGFLAICGGTGTGKSALIEAIYSSVKGEDDPQAFAAKRLEGTAYEIVVDTPDARFVRSGTLGGQDEAQDDYKPGARLVSLADRTSTLQQAFSELDLNVIKDGVSPVEMNDADREALSLVCGKHYQSVIYYELEIREGITAPFFEVVESPAMAYNSSTMSTGELSAFYLCWACLNAEAFGLLFVEEPEAFLPPASHRALVGLLGKHAIAKRLGLIITTHSTTVASEVPETSLVSLRRANSQSEPLVGDVRARVLRRLGLVPPKRCVAIVEDRLAAQVLNEIISIGALDDYAQFEIIVEVDGASAIISALEKMPKDVLSILLLGVLDGDQAEELAASKVRYPTVLLPFDVQMEGVLIHALRHKLDELPSLIGRDIETIRDALAQHEGEDDHDRFRAIAGTLRVEDSALARIALRFWMESAEKNATAVRTLVATLIEQLK